MKNRAESLPGSSPTKVHDRCVRSAADDLLYPPEATAGVIYVVRNPLDVAVSLAHHLHRPLPYAVKVMNSPDNYFCTDLAERDGNAIAPLFSQHVSSWSDHVLSWLNEPRHRRLLVRYEDLLADPKAEMKRIMELLDVPWNAEKAQAVVGFCTFSKLQSEEEKSGFWEKPPNAPNFFRKGSSGDWRSSLPPELAVRICLDHGEVMKRVGHGAEVEEVLSS
jgi:aryl sulfotransferase